LLFRTPCQARGTEFDTRHQRAREAHTRDLISLIGAPDAFELLDALIQMPNLANQHELL